MSIKKKIIAKTLSSNMQRADTITRAGITAEMKFSRGKQLIEVDPFKLIPDPQNPRPGELIDDKWIKNVLKAGTENSLCHLDSNSGEYLIPDFSTLSLDINFKLKESYEFLRDLAYSIRRDGLIEPIEVFLADKNHDPSYFIDSDLEYGYVILEGHQRRLAAMMAGVSHVTCIQITDESMLAKLKVKHRKLRRQLSENNLRKDLSVSQNYLIVKQLLLEPDNQNITAKELSNIIGLNEGIAIALRAICLKPDNYPPILFSRIVENKLTFSSIRQLVSKSYKDIEEALNSDSQLQVSSTKKKIVKPRGRSGGAVKKSAIFKISNREESFSLHKFLLSRFPEIKTEISEEWSFKNLEELLNKIKEMAINEKV